MEIIMSNGNKLSSKAFRHIMDMNNIKEYYGSK